jgi:uncharacterized membrane protein YccF (DUF307 family)
MSTLSTIDEKAFCKNLVVPLFSVGGSLLLTGMIVMIEILTIPHTFAESAVHRFASVITTPSEGSFLNLTDL